MKDAGLQPDNQIVFNADWPVNLQKFLASQAEQRKQDADYDAWLAAIKKYDVKPSEVPHNQGVGWKEALDDFLANRSAKAKALENQKARESSWLADLANNGLNQNDLSFAQWEAGLLQPVLNDKAQKAAVSSSF